MRSHRDSFAVILDQGIDRTRMRHSTFYDNTPNGPQGVCHISLADPFHERLRTLLYDTAVELNIPCHPKGTYAYTLCRVCACACVLSRAPLNVSCRPKTIYASCHR